MCYFHLLKKETKLAEVSPIYPNFIVSYNFICNQELSLEKEPVQKNYFIEKKLVKKQQQKKKSLQVNKQKRRKKIHDYSSFDDRSAVINLHFLRFFSFFFLLSR